MRTTEDRERQEMTASIPGEDVEIQRDRLDPNRLMIIRHSARGLKTHD